MTELRICLISTLSNNIEREGWEVNTLVCPRSPRATPAQRLATTEQSVAASWTRSILRVVVMKGPRWSCSCGDHAGGGSACFARFHPSKTSNCKEESRSSGLSLQQRFSIAAKTPTWLSTPTQTGVHHWQVQIQTCLVDSSMVEI